MNPDAIATVQAVTTSYLAAWDYVGYNRSARVWVPTGATVEVEIHSGNVWGVTYKGRKLTAARRVVMEATA